MRSALAVPVRVAGQMVAAAAIAAAVAVVSLLAIARVEWPAYNSSNQLHALTTVGQVACLAGLLASGWLWRRGRQLAARLGSVLFLAAFSVVTLAMPLGATRLYLFGISVDQQFRTEYLTRLTDTAELHDMTYIGLPPFYPPGWFWLGGRLAALTGTPAWEMFKPWSIISITVAMVLALVLWAAMIRFEYALVVSTATAAAALAYSPAEPYAAIIAVLLPPVFVLAWSGLRGGKRPGEAGTTHSGGWAAIVGTGIFLGVAALFYTLLLAYAAFTLTLMAALVAVTRRHWEPLLRLLVIAVISGAIALIGWAPYLLEAATGTPADTGTAQHYLPKDGAELSFPMLQFTLLGALGMLGTLWLVIYARTSTRAGALAAAVLAVYAWSLLSMLTTLVGTTLLSFRLQPTLTILLAAAGAFGFIDITRALAARVKTVNAQRVVAAATAIGALGAVTFSQDIPDVLRPDIVVAYTDTDGYGERADRRPPGAEQYYREIDDRILEVTGRPRNETVVMTADYSFLSYYPYYGFQGLTSHYANPLAQFDARARAIESWALMSESDEFIAALDAMPWPPPSVFLMRRGANDTYTLRLAADVYPNQPNVRRYHVKLDDALFDDPRFDVSTIGPFVLAIRKPITI
ncbi:MULTISPECIES: galactan 5-O-arabinofuranosyltransferase [Mycobacteriaceae]|uniref:Galactan 5-O-arabinofuranosyltransferase n=1 Tax=Mycolicibacterium parafortuitum TaxID=39692 RepID=A0ACC6MB23_MYCPF|nr:MULTISPECIES: galactan 5-O-arabinofuranosyltransferase [Mycobacteriaceae]MDZ5084138.1 galactan 5-O-arabinofuranosyltransferase [Mycolicibacterium parafortuitum]GFM16828.1 transmembrane protein [Mycobacterium sp. PO1]GFM24091.1 transmembrane protein [Mycobacterium sp. PO2]